MSGFARILIRLPNWLGDVLLARPALHALRAAHPRAELVGVAPAPLRALVGWEAALDRLEAWGEGAERAALIARTRRWAPDAALVLPASFSSAWFAWRSGAPVRAGYRHEGRAILLTHAPPRPPRGDLHLSEEYVALAGALGARAATPPSLTVAAPARAEARALRVRHGLGTRPYAVLGPGATFGPAKRWGVDRFAALGTALARRDLAIVTCGARGDAAACAEVARAIGADARSLAGETSLLVQAALCADSVVTVCNDSGLAHLSAAVGAPTVAIFGSTSSAWTAPLGARVRVVQRAPVCGPCFQRTCRIGTRCLVAVEVAEVLEACAAATA